MAKSAFGAPHLVGVPDLRACPTPRGSPAPSSGTPSKTGGREYLDGERGGSLRRPRARVVPHVHGRRRGAWPRASPAPPRARSSGARPDGLPPRDFLCSPTCRTGVASRSPARMHDDPRRRADVTVRLPGVPERAGVEDDARIRRSAARWTSTRTSFASAAGSGTQSPGPRGAGPTGSATRRQRPPAESAGKSSSGSEDGSGSASRSPRGGAGTARLRAPRRRASPRTRAGAFFCGRGAAARAPRFGRHAT